MKKFFIAFCFCLFSWSIWAVDFPFLTGQVVDEAGILTQQTKNRIQSMLRPNQQFVVVTLKSLRGMEIEEYGVALGRHWGIGSKEKSDGVLLIVAPNDRQTRIEVGYGLEHVLTDAKCGLIVQNVLLPAFRNGDYNGGVLRASDLIMRIIAGEQVNIEPPVSISSVLILLSIFFLLVFGIYLYLGRPIEHHSGRHGGFWGGFGGGGFGGGSSGGGFSGGGGSFGGGGASGRW